MNTESIKNNSNKTADSTLIEMLRDLINKLESGECCYIKGCLMLETEEGLFSFRNAGLNRADALLLIEVSKQNLLMGAVE